MLCKVVLVLMVLVKEFNYWIGIVIVRRHCRLQSRSVVFIMPASPKLILYLLGFHASWSFVPSYTKQFFNISQLNLFIADCSITWCNGTTPVSSLKASVELSARTWPRPRTNMWILEELPRTAWSYTGAMSMISMRLARMARLACCPVTTSYPWMLLFSLLIRLAHSL